MTTARSRDRLFLLQLAGPPGVGKSRLADSIASLTDAVVLNQDIVKSTLLDAGVAWTTAGPAGYAVLFAVADDHLRHGTSVVIDSPSHYARIPESGRRVADKHGARYRFLELTCPDREQLTARLRGREPMRSQMPGLDQLPPDATEPSAAKRIGPHEWETAKPPDGVLVLDTTVSYETLVASAMAYVRQEPGSRD